MYRKATHTDQYLNGLSHHPLEHKRSVVRSLLNRAENIVSDNADKSQEIDHIHRVLKQNDFEPWMMNIPRKKNFTPSKQQPNPNISSRSLPIALPYIRGLSEKLHRIFRQHGLSVYHKPYNTIRELLVNPKDKLDKLKKCGAIYEITCGGCEDIYIGETARPLKVRLKEHTRRTPPLTAVGEHCTNTGHNIPVQNVKVLDTEQLWLRRKVKEAILIKERHPVLNRDKGLELPAIYDHIVVSHGTSVPSHVTQQ